MTEFTTGTQMQTEMADQPAVIRALLDRRTVIVSVLQNNAPDALDGVTFVARGSSENAATIGRYAAETITGKPSGIAALSMFNRYGQILDYHNRYVVAISQSGQTPEVVDYLAAANGNGARSVAITNGHDSPLAAAADHTIVLNAGNEVAVPATKTFTATVAALLVFAESLGEAPWTPHWDQVPETIQKVLDAPLDDTLIERLATADRIVVVARGFLYGAAVEAALKIQETCAIPVSSYSSADLYHGPIGAFGDKTVAIVFGAGGATAGDAVEVQQRLTDADVDVIAIGQPFDDADIAFSVDHEALSTFPAVVAAQRLALGLARRLGLDPANPEGLTKVTRTS